MRKAFWARTVRCAAHMPNEALTRIPGLAILTIATVSIGPAAAQTYDPAYPVCLRDRGATITNAATRRCLSATCQHRAARPSASSIHILRARKRPLGGIAASTKAYFGADKLNEI